MSLDKLISEVFDMVRYSKLSDAELIERIMHNREVSERIAKMAIQWVRDEIKRFEESLWLSNFRY